MFVGAILGVLSVVFDLGDFVRDWIKPFGTIFINLLKLIAIPLIMVSLISGVSNLRDITKLSRIGGKTLSLYLITTVIAITVGLVSVNTIQPGKYLSEEKRIELGERYASDANMRVTAAESLTSAGPLQVIVDIVPDNIFGAASSNTNMLQVIFFAILFGVALILTNAEKAMPVKAFFDGANEAILKVVDIVMRYAPF